MTQATEITKKQAILSASALLCIEVICMSLPADKWPSSLINIVATAFISAAVIFHSRKQNNAIFREINDQNTPPAFEIIYNGVSHFIIPIYLSIVAALAQTQKHLSPSQQKDLFRVAALQLSIVFISAVKYLLSGYRMVLPKNHFTAGFNIISARYSYLRAAEAFIPNALLLIYNFIFLPLNRGQTHKGLLIYSLVMVLPIMSASTLYGAYHAYKQRGPQPKLSLRNFERDLLKLADAPLYTPFPATSSP